MEHIENLKIILAEYEKIMKKKELDKEKRKKYDMKVYKERHLSKFTPEEWAAKKSEYNRTYYERKKLKKLEAK